MQFWQLAHSNLLYTNHLSIQRLWKRCWQGNVRISELLDILFPHIQHWVGLCSCFSSIPMLSGIWWYLWCTPKIIDFKYWFLSTVSVFNLIWDVIYFVIFVNFFKFLEEYINSTDMINVRRHNLIVHTYALNSFGQFLNKDIRYSKYKCVQSLAILDKTHIRLWQCINRLMWQYVE